MPEALEIFEKPESDRVDMIVGWRQWADAGTVSSGLPQYLIEHTKAQKIAEIHPDGFYLFQIPGTHGLVRPVVKFNEGFPEYLETRRNEFFYAGDRERGVIFFLGDEPHMDIERYVATILQAAQYFDVQRVIGFGGVYGELPYDKERMITANYSLPRMKEEMHHLSVELTDYEGGASIGSMICKRAYEHNIEYAGLYAFVPTYDFSNVEQLGNAIRIETDYTAWLGVMQRVNYMLKLNFDLADLEEKSQELTKLLNKKVEEIDNLAPQLNVHEYFRRLNEDFNETPFDPTDEFWEEELKRLFNKFEDEDPEK